MKALQESFIDPLLVFQQSSVKVYVTGPDRFRLVGLDQLTGDQAAAVIDHARQLKSAIINRMTQSPAPCEVCPAAGLWDYGEYSGKGLLCFYSAWFQFRAGSPAPCQTARMSCPLLTHKEKFK